MIKIKVIDFWSKKRLKGGVSQGNCEQCEDVELVFGNWMRRDGVLFVNEHAQMPLTNQIFHFIRNCGCVKKFLRN